MIDVTPQPSAAPRLRRVAAHARLELTMLLRNGEQLLLTVVLPIGLLLVLTLTEIIDVGGSTRVERLGLVVPSMFALAVLSTSFTALAIQTGFERRYGVLRRIGTTPLSRFDVLAGKAVAVLAIEAAQVAALGALGLVLGWQPDPVGLALVVPFVVLGSATLASLALLLAGVVRAEATLAVANLAYLLLASAGVVVPIAKAPPSCPARSGAAAIGSSGREPADRHDQRRRRLVAGRRARRMGCRRSRRRGPLVPLGLSGRAATGS